MIASRESGITVQGNIGGQSFQAGIDDENMGWVISLFTDLYSDPQLAVIREYSTNARDAQIEAGYDGPIEITLPSALAPFFKVKDRGIGLSAENIQHVYSRYGSSTKRGTNDQNGMLGMGCKSALAYCQQFTVESVKDGMRTVCAISREEGGVPVFTVVASVPDDGENGTEVIVPVQRHHMDSFATKAAKFYSYWPEGTVLVNGEEPKRVEGLDLGDGMLLVKKMDYSYDREPNLVVMGGVAYPVTEEELSLGLPSTYSLVATVDIGSVEFAPSREALLYNKLTRGTLASLKPKVQAAIAKSVQAEIDKADTYRGAIRTMLQWRGLLGRHGTPAFKFKGADMPEKISGQFVLVPWHAHKQAVHQIAPNGVNAEYFADAIVVEGYDNATFTPTMKKKLLQYVADNELSQPKFFALCAARPVTKWIEDDTVIQWADVKATKLPATSSSYGWRSGRPTGSYDAYIGGTSQHIQADEIDQNEPVYYCRSMNKHESRDYADLIGHFFPTATVVCLPENRYAKFMRNFPEAKRHTDGIQAAYDSWLSKLTRGQRIALAINDRSDWDAFSLLDPSKVDDPEIRKACLIARNVKLKEITRARNRFRNFLHSVNTAKLGDSQWTCPLEKYTLLQHMTYRTPWRNAEIYVYLNARFALGFEDAAAEEAAA